MKYQVSFPSITTDHVRIFDTKEEADTFAAKRREMTSKFLGKHDWQRVTVSEVQE